MFENSTCKTSSNLPELSSLPKLKSNDKYFSEEFEGFKAYEVLGKICRYYLTVYVEYPRQVLRMKKFSALLDSSFLHTEQDWHPNF